MTLIGCEKSNETAVNPMLLIKVDPEAHVDRWYLIVVQPTLLDKSAVICAWGSRRSSYQRTKIFPVASAAEAEALAQKMIEKRIKRGYAPVGAQTPDQKEND